MKKRVFDEVTKRIYLLSCVILAAGMVGSCEQRKIRPEAVSLTKAAGSELEAEEERPREIEVDSETEENSETERIRKELV